MHPGRPSLDHLLHQLECVEIAAEPGLRIRHNRLEPVDPRLTLAHFNLIRALQTRIDPLHHRRHRIRRIERLIRIHLPRKIRIRRHLPAGEVNRLEPCPYLLHGLVARQRAQRIHIRQLGKITPEFLGGMCRNRMRNRQRAAQFHHIRTAIRPGDALPARVFVPVFFQAFSVEPRHRYSLVTRSLPTRTGVSSANRLQSSHHLRNCEMCC